MLNEILKYLENEFIYINKKMKDKGVNIDLMFI